jgi:hypothetical protein
LQKRFLSLSLSPSCSQHYRCCCLYFYRLYYYYFFCALTLFPFLFSFWPCSGPSCHDDWVFFSFFPLFSVFLFFFLSMLTLFPISKHTALLTGCYKKKHDDERTFRVIVWKREKEGERRRLPRRSLLDTKTRSFWCSLSL